MNKGRKINKEHKLKHQKTQIDTGWLIRYIEINRMTEKAKYKQSEIEMNRMTEKANINRVRQRQNGKNKIIKCEGGNCSGGRKKLKFIT